MPTIPSVRTATPLVSSSVRLMETVMTRFFVTLLTLLLALSACTDSTATTDPTPYTILPGTWGWQGTDDCKSFPIRIRFSADRKQMYLSAAPRKNDGTRKPRNEYTYNVLGDGTNVLHLSLVSEWRDDAGGTPITWYLVVIDHNAYFWNRSDWPHDTGTKSVVRCKPDK